MKTVQRKSLAMVPAKYRESARRSQNRQNRFARKTGLPVLNVLMNLVLGSLIVTLCFEVALNLFESGYLTMPKEISQKVQP